MSQTITATHERVDDIPAIIAHLKKMRVAELLDTHFPTNGNWEGLSLGWTTVVWLAFLLSEGDHRLYRVEPWVKAHRRTLSRCIGSQVKPRDLTDDRLAAILDYLSVADHWAAFERELKPTVCPSVASRNLLLYQSLPSSIPYRYALLRRRKDAPAVGTTASGTVA
jgi:Domain of unknown function (DUF4277)